LKKLIKKDAPLKAKLVPASWGAFFGELDSDGDGIIDKEEFVQFYISKCAPAQEEPAQGTFKGLMRRGTQGQEYTPDEEEVAVPPKNLDRKRRMSADLKASLENAEEEAAAEAAAAAEEAEEQIDDLFGTPRNPVESFTATVQSDDIMDLFGDFSGESVPAPTTSSDSVMMAPSNDSSDPFDFGDFGSAPAAATNDSTMSASASDSLFDLLGDFNSAPAPDEAVAPDPAPGGEAPVDSLEQAFEENVAVPEDSNPEDKLTQSSTGAWLTTDGRKWLSTPKGKQMAIKHQKSLDKK